MATIVLCSGAEHGLTGGNATGVAGSLLLDGVTGTLGTTITIVTPGRDGSTGRAWRIGASSQIGWGTNTLGTSKTVFTGSVWIKISTDPSNPKDILTQDTAALVADVGFTYIPATDKIHAYNGASTADSVLNYTTSSGWVLLEWEYNCAGGTHTLKWRLDGVAQTQVDAAKTASTISTVDLGGTGASGAVDYDDFVCSVTGSEYPLGPHKVVPLTVDPGATVTLSGTTGNWNTFTGATPTLSAWNATTARDAVDEVPPNTGSSQDGFAQITLSATDYVETPMTSYTLVNGETVAGARLIACLWEASAASATIGFRSFNGTTETTLLAATAYTNAGNNTTTPGWACKMLTLADINTQGELDALAIRTGFSTDATPDIGVQAIYVELAVFTGNAVPAPAVVTAVAALPRPNVNTVAVQSAVAAVGALPRPNVNVSTVPAVLAAVVALPTPTVTVTGSATATPATVGVTVALPRPDVSASAVLAVLAAVAALPQPAVNTTITPAVLAAVAGLARPNVNVRVGPAVLAALVALARPAVNVSVAPGVLAVTAVLPTPAVVTSGNAVAQPSTIMAAAALPQPSVHVSAVLGLVTASAALFTPTVVAQSNATAFPATVGLVVNLGQAVAVESTPGPGLLVSADRYVGNLSGVDRATGQLLAGRDHRVGELS